MDEGTKLGTGIKFMLVMLIMLVMLKVHYLLPFEESALNDVE